MPTVTHTITTRGDAQCVGSGPVRTALSWCRTCARHGSPNVCISVCMARMNVYVPDDLAERARSHGLNISALAQAAIRAALERSATDQWLEEIAGTPTAVRHDDVLAAIDAARDELGE